MSAVLEGACHCGNLTLELALPAGADELPLRACTCSFCRTRRARWTSAPAGRVTLAAREPSLVSRYRFGTRTADFVLCARCGVHVAATCEIDGALYAVLNGDCIPALRDADRVADAVSFDGEEVGDRIARRARSWTPASWLADPSPVA